MLSAVDRNFSKGPRAIRKYMHTYWYQIGLALIWLLSLSLRLWGLGEIDGPAFDEVYFPRYGYDYLTGAEFFHVHPPLANYFMMASIRIYHALPWIDAAPLGSTPFEAIDPYSYRWLNAFLGSLLGPTLAFVAWGLSGNKTFALVAAGLFSLDGALLVDSRFGMNNLYLVLFGFLAIGCAAHAHFRTVFPRRWLLASGVFLGCAVAVKWNGLGYWLAMIFTFTAIVSMIVVDRYRPPRDLDMSSSSNVALAATGWEYLVFFLLTPMLVYCLLWVPDRMFNTEFNFLTIHQQIFSYHSGVGSDDHPYCSEWYTWPLLLRSVGYVFSQRELDGSRYFTDVHLLGNPLLHWLSSAAVVVMLGHWLHCFWQWFHTGKNSRLFFLLTAVLAGYCANLLPWAFIQRCVLLYHYESASVFAFTALAWYLTHALRSRIALVKITAGTVLAFIIVTFIYFLPLYIGLEIEQGSFYARMWMESWI